MGSNSKIYEQRERNEMKELAIFVRVTLFSNGKNSSDRHSPCWNIRLDREFRIKSFSDKGFIQEEYVLSHQKFYSRKISRNTTCIP